MKRMLLCTDLDRTLIANGEQPPSSGSLSIFEHLTERQDVTLAYVSGRDRGLIERAIAEFELPVPDFVIADVGATIYRVDAAGWQHWGQWDEQIAPEWRGLSGAEIYRKLSVFSVLRLQEAEKQGRHKLSFYVPLDTDMQGLLYEIDMHLKSSGINANLIWSIDEAADTGLLDVLPAGANKLHAIRFLMQQAGFANENTLFAGDSGNDLDVLLSEIPSVLVANADEEVKNRAMAADKLYIAKGGYLGMNGNYSAGILEGVAHYWPQIGSWLSEIANTEGV